jgi:hypothetical protein
LKFPLTDSTSRLAHLVTTEQRSVCIRIERRCGELVCVRTQAVGPPARLRRQALVPWAWGQVPDGGGRLAAVGGKLDAIEIDLHDSPCGGTLNHIGHRCVGNGRRDGSDDGEDDGPVRIAD